MTNVIELADAWHDELEPTYAGGGDLTKPFYYLAGPMTGIPKFNFPAFYSAAEKMRHMNYNIVNPAELDEEIERREAELSPDGEHRHLEHVKTWEDCLRRDVAVVTHANCVGVILIPGWENSNGARLETYVANALGLKLYEMHEPDSDGWHMNELDSRRAALEAAGVIDG